MVEVRQEDREAAADALMSARPLLAGVVRDGQMDLYAGVQAFARHREAAEARTVAAIVAWLREHEGDHARVFANAIERGEWREGAR